MSINKLDGTAQFLQKTPKLFKLLGGKRVFGPFLSVAGLTLLVEYARGRLVDGYGEGFRNAPNAKDLLAFVIRLSPVEVRKLQNDKVNLIRSRAADYPSVFPRFLLETERYCAESGEQAVGGAH